MFKKKRGINLSYYKQGFIYFTCVCFHSLEKKERNEILRLCEEVGGVHTDALFCLLTRPEFTVTGVSMRYHVSEKKLIAYRKAFYELYWRQVMGKK